MITGVEDQTERAEPDVLHLRLDQMNSPPPPDSSPEGARWQAAPDRIVRLYLWQQMYDAALDTLGDSYPSLCEHFRGNPIPFPRSASHLRASCDSLRSDQMKAELTAEAAERLRAHEIALSHLSEFENQLERSRSDVPWQENVSVVTSGGQDQEINSYLFLDDLAQHVLESASLAEAFRQCARSGYRTEFDGKEGFQTPLVRIGGREPWVAADRNQSRRLLVVNGIPNPVDPDVASFAPSFTLETHDDGSPVLVTDQDIDDLQSFVKFTTDLGHLQFSTFEIIGAMIDKYGLTSDHFDILEYPDLELLRSSMEWLGEADEACIILCGHGGSTGYESGIQKHEQSLQGARKSYVALQNQKLCGQITRIDSDTLKQMAGEILPPEKVHSLALAIATCYSGGFLI